MEGTTAVGSVVAAGGVAEEGSGAVGSVVDAGGVGAKGTIAVGSVVAAGGVGGEGIATQSRVGSGSATKDNARNSWGSG